MLIGDVARYFGLERRRPFGFPNIAGSPADPRRAGILTLGTMKVATLNEMLEEVVRLGEATGTADEAHELRGELEGRLATVRAAVAGATVPRVSRSSASTTRPAWRASGCRR